MPKIKTHHWAGVTLSMKNMFGIVPGTKYRWPKNILHWKGIHRSILDICATAPLHFVIADGVIAMEGNGPLHGTHRDLGKIVLADDPVAVDFMCAHLMGSTQSLVWHLDRASHFSRTARLATSTWSQSDCRGGSAVRRASRVRASPAASVDSWPPPVASWRIAPRTFFELSELPGLAVYCPGTFFGFVVLLG
jgi:hypothetical protein